MLRKFKKIKVIEYSGYKVNEKPKQFFYKNRRYIISEIIETYYEKIIEENQNYKVFKIKTKNGEIFTLFYLLHKAEWFIEDK